MEQQLSKSEAIRNTLSLTYEIRYNPLTGKIEYTEIGGEDFKEVDKAILSTMKARLMDNGISASDADIRKTFGSQVFHRDNTPEGAEIEQYIQSSMQCRFNVIKSRAEYRLSYDGDWKPVDKYFLNSLARQLKALGYKTSRQYLCDLFESDFSPKINPLAQYFEELDKNYIESPIEQLANTVLVKNNPNWQEYLRKWLVATVANVFVEDRCTNHTMLILCGAQGAFKTTWIENLIPVKIKRYMYSGKLDMDKDKDNNTYLAENLIINLDDQMRDLLSTRGYEAIKNIITKNYITYRRPYDPQPSDYPRLASLIGSINGIDFLNDPTGSRRFLPFEVESINIDAAKAMDMELVWQEAYDLYKEGYRYYFTQDEIRELTLQNERFSALSMEEELLLKMYKAVPESNPGAVFVQTSEIVEQMTLNTPLKLRESKIFDALKKHGFVKTRKVVDAGSREAKYGYYVLRFKEPLTR